MDSTAQQMNRPGFSPLYQQVRKLLLSRIAEGVWRESETLPSEHALAIEFGVSQGTIRKALDSLAADRLIERRQGKGTFIAQHTPESAQFRFFKLNSDTTGDRAVPRCDRSTISKRKANATERTALDLQTGEQIFCILRTRFVEDEPMLHEQIVVAVALMPDLSAYRPLPNTLYNFYQSRYNTIVSNAKEKIKAVAAEKNHAQILEVTQGAPLLLVERRAFGLNNCPVEYRRTFYRTDQHHYSIDLM